MNEGHEKFGRAEFVLSAMPLGYKNLTGHTVYMEESENANTNKKIWADVGSCRETEFANALGILMVTSIRTNLSRKPIR